VLAYLELMAPTLAEAVDKVVADGATTVDVVPLFLGTGGHLRQDLPPLVDALRSAHPDVTIRLHAAIGEHAAVSEAMARAALVAAGLNERPARP
jgi:sirohydrochlorin cobaltochelatase